MTEERRAILEQVASGRLDPAEAARLLDELDELTEAHARTEAQPEDREPPPFAAPLDAEQLRGIRVVASAGSVRVIGDPDVAEAAVTGPHTLRRAGDILVVECGPLHSRGPEMHLFGALGTPGAGAWFTSAEPPPRMHLPRWRSSWRQATVRVNPSIPLDLELTAGQLVLRGSRAALRCTVSAGSATLHDVQGPVAATAAAGSLSVRGPIRNGESRIECDMGSASVQLEDGADVRIRVRTSLGRAVVDLDEALEPEGGGPQEWVVGSGRATLEIQANLGSVSVQRSAFDEPVADAG